MILPTTCASDRPPVVSVVIASYNYGHFLPQAIRSVQAQTLQDWECIIVDDASTDNTLEVVAGFIRDDPRIRYERNSTNLGEAGSRNRGNSLSRGQFIAVLDADDWWEPDKLESQLQAVRHVPGAVLCFTGKKKVYPAGLQTTLCKQDWLRNLDRGLHIDNQILHSSVLVLRSALEVVNGYDETLPSAPDWDLWLRLMHRFGVFSFVHVDRPLVYYRIHGSNISRNWEKMIPAERIVLWRALMRGFWGLRNPGSTLDVITEQLSRESAHFDEVGLVWRSFYRTCALISLAPWRRWRWHRLTSHMARWKGRGGKPATLG